MKDTVSALRGADVDVTVVTQAPDEPGFLRPVPPRADIGSSGPHRWTHRGQRGSPAAST